jgi:hypothetical protein
MIKAGATTTGVTGRSPSPRAEARQARAERLAAALRANLRRRKVQARERAAEPDQPGPDTEPAGNAENK